jgi:hypothetical protein
MGRKIESRHGFLEKNKQSDTCLPVLFGYVKAQIRDKSKSKNFSDETEMKTWCSANSFSNDATGTSQNVDVVDA